MEPTINQLVTLKLRTVNFSVQVKYVTLYSVTSESGFFIFLRSGWKGTNQIVRSSTPSILSMSFTENPVTLYTVKYQLSRTESIPEASPNTPSWYTVTRELRKSSSSLASWLITMTISYATLLCFFSGGSGSRCYTSMPCFSHQIGNGRQVTLGNGTRSAARIPSFPPKIPQQDAAFNASSTVSHRSLLFFK